MLARHGLLCNDGLLVIRSTYRCDYFDGQLKIEAPSQLLLKQASCDLMRSLGVPIFHIKYLGVNIFPRLATSLLFTQIRCLVSLYIKIHSSMKIHHVNILLIIFI